MKKTMTIGVAAALLLLGVLPEAAAWHGHRGPRRSSHLHLGFHFFIPFYPGPFYPRPYVGAPYPAPFYYPPPPVYSYVPPAQVLSDVGYLRLEIWPSDAHLYLNGRYLGPVQQFAGVVPLARGAHQVAVVAWGHRPFQREVEILPGQTSILNVSLEPDPSAPPPPAPGQGPGGSGGSVAPQEEAR